MSFFENTRKPVGLGGKIMVAMMNFGHSAMAEWGLHFLQPAPDAMVLDCGCGGGANMKTLLKLCPNGKVQGIDYSAVSVEKARKVNARAMHLTASAKVSTPPPAMTTLSTPLPSVISITCFQIGPFL